jgi:hypothetical protein
MHAPQEEFYGKAEIEVWIAFDCRGPGAENRLYQECRAWGPRATLEDLGFGRIVMVIRPGGAWELAG